MRDAAALLVWFLHCMGWVGFFLDSATMMWIFFVSSAALAVPVTRDVKKGKS
jgi:hypothetical protein